MARSKNNRKFFINKLMNYINEHFWYTPFYIHSPHKYFIIVFFFCIFAQEKEHITTKWPEEIVFSLPSNSSVQLERIQYRMESSLVDGKGAAMTQHSTS